MTLTRRSLGAVLGAALATPALGQSWPSRTIRIVVPFPPGGSTDTLARRLAEKLTAALGQTVVVENRPGAGGTVGADMVAKSPPDGHTLLMGVTGSNAIAGSLFRTLPYDPANAFAPLSRVVSAPLILVVNKDQPIQDLAGYIAAAKAANGGLTYATPGNGTSMHLTGVMFGQAAKVELTHVPYRGSAAALTDLVGGQVQSSFADFLVALPQVRAGALRALAVTSPARHPLLPQVPTMDEAGLPGFAATSWQGLFAPAGTPAPIMARLHAEVARAMTAPEIKDSFAAQGFTVEATTPAEFDAFVRAEVAKWAVVVREGRISLD
ncbi:tripartite tricarboxylate transporter substrate binding protein [Roseomonas frigidaquae]|uniref:Tripartite tricarboxylate transporter substrate binding protein n=1 Tax=Falsiroseomonas frigidaquae TaxID=487318 RepID=A0ABX1ETI5_9PROT|nr:tripartite tricarboxylate transporter substrate binding protein [Falsiroseomonas frigidaquae]NKE43946.1 tripartite tricarboxylate transporter substrate binding protein [Falsiroseomonas frigidaquae]